MLCSHAPLEAKAIRAESTILLTSAQEYFANFAGAHAARRRAHAPTQRGVHRAVIGTMDAALNFV
jgi:hypothetical protein